MSIWNKHISCFIYRRTVYGVYTWYLKSYSIIRRGDECLVAHACWLQSLCCPGENAQRTTPGHLCDDFTIEHQGWGSSTRPAITHLSNSCSHSWRFNFICLSCRNVPTFSHEWLGETDMLERKKIKKLWGLIGIVHTTVADLDTVDLRRYDCTDMDPNQMQPNTNEKPLAENHRSKGGLPEVCFAYCHPSSSPDQTTNPRMCALSTSDEHSYWKLYDDTIIEAKSYWRPCILYIYSSRILFVCLLIQIKINYPSLPGVRYCSNAFRVHIFSRWHKPPSPVYWSASFHFFDTGLSKSHAFKPLHRRNHHRFQVEPHL